MIRGETCPASGRRDLVVVVMTPVVVPPFVVIFGVHVAILLGVAAMRPAVPMMVAVVIAVGITKGDIAEIEGDAGGSVGAAGQSQRGARQCDQSSGKFDVHG